MATNPQNPWEMQWPKPATPQARQPGPLPSPPKPAPDREPKTTYRTMTPEEAAANGLPAGGTYQVSSEGNISTVVAAPKDAGGKALPDAAAKRIEGGVGTYSSLSGSLEGFKDEYAGNTLTGNAENVLQGLYSGFGSEGQRNWWANFKSVDNVIRNELFGAALTPAERAAYEATTVDPSLDPKIVRENIQKRVEILGTALDRQKRFMLANGYNADAVNILYEPLAAMEALKGAPADNDDDAKKEVPVMGAPPTAGAGTSGQGIDKVAPGDAGLTLPTSDPGAETPVAVGEDKRGKYVAPDPVMVSTYHKMLDKAVKANDADIVLNWLDRMGIDKAGAIEQFRYLRQYPKVPADSMPVQGHYITEQITDADKQMNEAAQSPGGAFVANAGDAATGYNLDSIIGATGGNAERARGALDYMNEKNPGASIAGQLGGGVAAALLGEAALGRAGVSNVMARTLGADTGYGAAAGAGGTDYDSNGNPATVADRLMGAGKGAAAGLAGSYLGGKVAGGLQRMAKGPADASVAAMNRNAVPLTLGQQVGRAGRVGAAVKSAEDRLAGFWGVGDMVNARRAEGIDAFNSKTFDKALAPIGGSVKGLVGEEAVAAAQKQVSRAFDDALGGKAVMPDPQFGADFTKALTRLGKAEPKVMDDVVEVFRRFDREPALTGEALQEISRELRDIKAAYKLDPRFRRIAPAIDDVEDSVFGIFDRNAPGTTEAYSKAKTAYRRLAIVEDAVLRGQNQEGRFTPAQLGAADKRNTIKYQGRGAAARGDGPFAEWQRDAQNVLPNKVPDSGTAGRLLVPGVLIGGGTGIDAVTGGDGTATTIGAIVAGAYTRAGQRLLTKAGRGVKNVGVKRVLENDMTRQAISGASAAEGVRRITGP